MENLVVKVKEGLVEGCISAKGKCRVFKGVPYAEPPVGELRFMRARAKKPWNGIRTCKSYSAKCFQADMTKDAFYGKEFYAGDMPCMSEDSLYLNIWAPEHAKDLPVLMWIHGGAYMHGCGSEIEFEGEGMADKGVIMVSINYRVGALGFFAHEDLEEDGISGDLGMSDQIAALTWIYENISAFGGDPERITIAGQSAGCMSVQSLLSCDETKHMIKGAILQSAGGIPGLMPFPDKTTMYETSKQLMEVLHVTTVEEMKQLSAEDICNGGYTINEKRGTLSWTPYIDGKILKDNFAELAKKGMIHDVPIMIGSTEEELGNGTGELLRESAVNFAENQASLHKKPVYVYHFERKLPGDHAGAFHSSELWYEFMTMDQCWRPFEQHDYDLSEELSNEFVRFITTGDPGYPAYSENGFVKIYR